jgi:hypothetical protein
MTLHTFKSAIAWIRRRKLKHEREGLERLLQDLHRQAYEDQLEREHNERTQGISNAKTTAHETPG